MQHSENKASKPIVVCLPGDSKSGWSSRTWKTLSQKFSSAGMAFAVLEYPRLEVLGDDICPLHLAADAWDQMWELLSDLGFPTVRSVIASSFGAAVFLERPNKFEYLQFVCFKSPAVDLLPPYLHDFGLEKIRKWSRCSRNSCPGQAFDAILRAKSYSSAKLMEAPSMVLHGSHDEDVPISQSELLSAILPNSNFRTLVGADHRLSEFAHWNAAIEEITNSITSSARINNMNDGE